MSLWQTVVSGVPTGKGSSRFGSSSVAPVVSVAPGASVHRLHTPEPSSRPLHATVATVHRLHTAGATTAGRRALAPAAVPRVRVRTPATVAPVRHLHAVDAVPLAAQAATKPAVCKCGHGQDAHEHYRRGSDCALCDCPRFRRS